MKRVAATLGALTAGLFAVACGAIAFLLVIGMAPGAGPETQGSAAAWAAAAMMMGFGALCGWCFDKAR